jgi:hypothetical protein
VDNVESEFDLLDTPGSESAFQKLFIEQKNTKYADLDAYFLIYDLTNQESFKALEPLHSFFTAK